MAVLINSPGHWQHFILRNDNRGLTIEQMRQKYLKEQFTYESYMGIIQQQQITMSNTSAGGGREVANGCPTITIGDNQESGIVFINDGGGLLALISGGEPVYTIGTITGTVPSGFNLDITEIDGEYYVYFDLKADTFGSYTFSVTVLDANNCESAAKTFTIEVWASFANKTEQVVTISDPFLINVSGLPSIYGSGVALDSITLTYISVGASYPNIKDPNGIPATLYNSSATGDVTDAVIYDITEAYPQFATGSTPYTGLFISGADSFTEFDGSDPNGNWQFRGVGGTIKSVSLVFKPV